MSSQRLTCQEENKLVISRAQDDRFECQTKLCMDSWETIGIGKVNIFFKLVHRGFRHHITEARRPDYQKYYV